MGLRKVPNTGPLKGSLWWSHIIPNRCIRAVTRAACCVPVAMVDTFARRLISIELFTLHFNFYPRPPVGASQ